MEVLTGRVGADQELVAQPPNHEELGWGDGSTVWRSLEVATPLSGHRPHTLNHMPHSISQSFCDPVGVIQLRLPRRDAKLDRLTAGDEPVPGNLPGDLFEVVERDR